MALTADIRDGITTVGIVATGNDTVGNRASAAVPINFYINLYIDITDDRYQHVL